MNAKNTAVQDFKIGLFVIAVLMVAAVSFFRIQKPEQKQGSLIHVHFGYVAGLTQGAPVSLAGVTIGEVHSVKVAKKDDEIGVDVALMVRQPEFVQPDSDFRISSKGLLGAKYIEIIPTNNEAENGIEHADYEGSDPVIFEKVLETGDRIAVKMEKTVDAVNHLITDKNFRNNLQQNAQNLSQLIIELRQTSALMNHLLTDLKNGKGTLGKLMTEEVIYNDLAEFVADIKQHPWKLFKKK